MYNSFNDNGYNNEPVPDPNGILTDKTYKKNISDVGQILKSNFGDFNGVNLDDEDISNLSNWYNNYKIAYSYPEQDNKLSKKWEGIFDKISRQKGKSDIMGLVEISIGRLLQNEFEEKGHNVRIRKTTNFDDITSGIDYIVEFKDNNENITEIIGIDFTISEIGANSLLKNIKKESYPSDYKKYYEKKNDKKLKKIPRIVVSFPRDIAYSFTNNYITDVLNKGRLLDNENISENFELAIQDLNKTSFSGIHFKVSERVENTNSKINNILNIFKYDK